MMRKLGLAAAISAAVLLVVIGLLHLTARPAQPHDWAEQVLVIAHQGGNHLRPDNTLVSFQHAVDLGADVLEMDLHTTADGVVVVIHDDTVDRTTDGTGRVNDLTLAELQALDAAYHWTPLTPEGDPIDPDDRPYRGEGITVPTLAEVFTAFPAMPMVIEIKQAEPSMAEPLCAVIRAHDMADQLIVASFSVDALEEFRAVCPGVPTSAHQTEALTFYVFYQLRMAPAYTPREYIAFQVPETFNGLRVLSDRFITAADRRGISVQAWTINTEDDMRRLIDWGVHGLITDQPGLALEVLGR
ncbi:MAG: glycerophosphodiester phosphodiesterase [Chloroflexi bacterium]|nr:glycerophosphodiester phosphodiesterase [Chloroflexota bacterium]